MGAGDLLVALTKAVMECFVFEEWLGVPIEHLGFFTARNYRHRRSN
jgi:hypothetical protein